MKAFRHLDWLAPVAAAFGLAVLVALFAHELRDFRRAVVGWADRDLKVRAELAAATLSEPLATSDFRRIHAFGDDCARDGVRLTVRGAHGGVFFDTLRQGEPEADSLYETASCGEFTVRLGMPLARVLAPVERARKGLVLAGCLGGFAVLIVFFFSCRQRVRIRELARLERFRRDFIADVSHEIKTPLTGILGAVDLMEGDSPLVPLVRKEAKRLNALVQSVLDLARLERGEGAVRPMETDLNDLVDETLRTLTPQAEARGVRLVREPSAESVVVRADPALLSQALSNLVINALRHAGSPDVVVSVRVRDPWVELAVEDHGIGIPPEHRERVFERFHRVDPARAAESGGAGLGLAIVRNIARLHGGEVRLDPVFPQGSRFILRLPRA